MNFENGETAIKLSLGSLVAVVGIMVGAMASYAVFDREVDKQQTHNVSVQAVMLEKLSAIETLLAKVEFSISDHVDPRKTGHPMMQTEILANARELRSLEVKFEDFVQDVGEIKSNQKTILAHIKHLDDRLK